MNSSSQTSAGHNMAAHLQSATAPTDVATPHLASRFLIVGEGRVAYDDTGGSGPLVLAIPGMGDLRSEYRALRPWLQQAGYRVVTMDVRGHGETSALWSDYSAHAVGRDALALIEHLGAGPAVILGNSFAAGSALVVMGTRDPDFPDATAEALWLGKALCTEPLIVEGAGHYRTWKRPITWPPP